jgi:hypothetical protein
LAILAKISTAFENAIFKCLHFQLVGETENGRASCPAGNAELISVSLGCGERGEPHRPAFAARTMRFVPHRILRGFSASKDQK